MSLFINLCYFKEERPDGNLFSKLSGAEAPNQPPMAARGRNHIMKKIETKSTVLLAHHLKALRLPTILAECEKVAARCATDNIDHLAFLLQLCEL